MIATSSPEFLLTSTSIFAASMRSRFAGAGNEVSARLRTISFYLVVIIGKTAKSL
jgi:hypothetical protein